MKRPQIIVTFADHKKLNALLEEQRRYNQNRLPESFRSLATELERAELKDPAEIGSDVITMNSTARVVELETNDTMEYTLVYPEDADIESGKISVLAPLGTAMLGYRTGDVFQWEVPLGVRRFKVDAVLFQPEHAAQVAQSTEAA